MSENSSGKREFQDNGAVWVRKDRDKEGKPRTYLSMIVDGVSYVAWTNNPRDKDGNPRQRSEKEPNFRVYKSKPLASAKSAPKAKTQPQDEEAPF